MAAIPGFRRARATVAHGPAPVHAGDVERGGRALPDGWGVARPRLSRTMTAALALLAVAVVGLTQVLQTSSVAATGWNIRTMEAERQDLDSENRLLEARLAQNANLDHLRRTAAERLGMVPAGDTVKIKVDAEAPNVVPLPRRYVTPVEPREAPKRTWWEAVLGAIPGVN